MMPINFSAGPSILAPQVTQASAEAFQSLPGVGLSVAEISHRSRPFEAILFETRDRIRRLMAVPESHEILFLQGGARHQFAMVPLNFLRDKTSYYLDSGIWSSGAFSEAKTLGKAEILAESPERDFRQLPNTSKLTIPSESAYIHSTSNNTIYGTQYAEIPTFSGHHNVCDMSSDIASRPIDVSKFSLIYAGAQKNAGIAGVTIIIIDKAWMAEGRNDIPSIWQYRIQAKNDSMYNTPPTFAIFVLNQTLLWVQEQGGVQAMAKLAQKRQQLIHQAIDDSNGYYRHAVPIAAHRSTMNITWNLRTPELETQFYKQAEQAGLIGLKGHRIIGGIRASVYNQMPLSGVERLVEFMADFRKNNP